LPFQRVAQFRAYFASVLLSFLFYFLLFLLFKDYVSRFVAMAAADIWLAATFFATLLSHYIPFLVNKLYILVVRLIRWTRHTQFVESIFPVHEGTHPNQQDVEPQANVNASPIAQMRDAVRNGVQDGLRTVDIAPEWTTGVRQQGDVIAQLLEEVRNLRTDTYTVTTTIARQARQVG
jgi:hypothetical protein